ncbi:hypothetical protein IFR35_09825 [Pseudomonas fluorescens]|uniref:hypothetical protein n=1 Tax=Pseudomonas fluorescens TaxID=294 RepID=UPI0017810C88|nr:hypothetical protein [Pseudomonas fluorescens]MBD8192168.1 hypothetical protein [Pseudomonas fluorescens]MBD8226792.1 hypothetical protein [Pseudomonas fluorescens]MBD8784505.1 hypothetical protein [Pseudomonas fluorescens]MBD8817185.1 hypothetical protein [Pseudomonas fluorescens]
MSFDNLPGQMIVLMLGWTFTVYLQVRSNNRAEALKRKDNIIDKLEALPGWLEDEISKDDFSLGRSEESFAGHVSQIEVKVGQLNRHVGKPIIDRVIFNRLMLFELMPKAEDNKALPYEVRDAAWDIIEKIESSCTDEYFARQGVLSFLKGYIYDFSGVILGVATIVVIVRLGSFLSDFNW